MSSFAHVISLLLILFTPSFANAQAHFQLATVSDSSSPNVTFPATPSERVPSEKCSQGISTCDTTGEIRQTLQGATVTPNIGVACVVTGGTYQVTTMYAAARCFILEEEGCNSNRKVDSVVFGVDIVADTVPLRINIFKDCGCLFGVPGQMNQELIGSASVSVSSIDNGSLKTVNINSNIAIAPYQAIRVEIEQLVDGDIYREEKPYFFFPGATSSPATGETFYRAPSCGVPAFTPLSQLGFSSSNIIIEVRTSASSSELSPLECCMEALCDSDLEICSDNKEKCILKPLCQDPPPNQCDFYRQCPEAAFDCGDTGYPLKFGEPMCKVYLDNESSFSPTLRVWAQKVRQCLQNALVPVLENRECNDCDVLETFAFNSHVPCYIDSGYCVDLYLEDIAVLFSYTFPALFSTAFGSIIAQFLSITYECKVLKYRARIAAVEAIFEEALDALLTRFNNEIASLSEYLLNNVFKQFLPNSIPTPYFTWSISAGSTRVVLVLTDDGINNPEVIAGNIRTGLSTGATLNLPELTLTVASVRTCTNAECSDIMGIELVQEKRCGIFCLIFNFFSRIFGNLLGK